MADHHSHPYLTYALHDEESQATLEIVPERGGMITRWQVLGHEILYMNWEGFQEPSSSVRGGISLLFPICGSLHHDTYAYNSRLYHLDQDGFAHRLPWEILEARKANSLTLRLQNHEHTLAQYPFLFECTVTYTLTGSCLHIQQSFINQGLHPMPFSMGLCPYFQVSDKMKLNLSIPSTHYFDYHGQQVFPLNADIDWNSTTLDWAFSNLQAQRTTISDYARNLDLIMEFDPVYSTLVLSTLKNHDFICLKPWSSGQNALNTGTRLCLIEPGDTLRSQVAIRVNMINALADHSPY